MTAIMSCAMGTGYRGITLVSLLFENIRVRVSRGDYRQLSLRFLDTKGPSTGPIDTSVEGMINDERGRNFIYHLREYIRFRLKDSTATLDDLHRLKGPVFLKKASHYSARMKHIARQAGLPFVK